MMRDVTASVTALCGTPREMTTQDACVVPELLPLSVQDLHARFLEMVMVFQYVLHGRARSRSPRQCGGAPALASSSSLPPSLSTAESPVQALVTPSCSATGGTEELRGEQ